MGQAAAAREQWLAAESDFKRWLAVNGAGDLNALPEALLAEGVAKADALNAAKRKSEALLEIEAQSRAQQRPAGMDGYPTLAGRAPYSAAAAGQAPAVRSYHGVSLGNAVLESINRQGSGMQAAILTNGSTAVPVPLNPTPVRIGYRTEFLRSLIPGMDAPVGQFAYMQQSLRTPNAGVIAPGGLKPTTIATLLRINDRTRQIATLSEPANRVDLADAPLLRNFVDNELTLALDLATDDQIINGPGTGETMTGIRFQSGVQTQAFATDIITTIRKAITKLRVSELVPDGIVLNPADWEKVELAAMAQFAAKDNVGTPIDAMTRTLFGHPVVETNAVPAGTAVVGAWQTSSVLYTTGGVEVSWSENSYDKDALGAGLGAGDFARNLVRFRAEMRAQVAWTRPAGFVLATLA